MHHKTNDHILLSTIQPKRIFHTIEVALSVLRYISHYRYNRMLRRLNPSTVHYNDSWFALGLGQNSGFCMDFFLLLYL